MKSKVFVFLFACLCFVGSPVYVNAGESVTTKSESSNTVTIMDNLEYKNFELGKKYTVETSYGSVEFLPEKKDGVVKVSIDTTVKESKPLASKSADIAISGSMGADHNIIKSIERVMSMLLGLIAAGVICIIFVVQPAINKYKSVVKSREYKTLQDMYDELNLDREGQDSNELQ